MDLYSGHPFPQEGQRALRTRGPPYSQGFRSSPTTEVNGQCLGMFQQNLAQMAVGL